MSSVEGPAAHGYWENWNFRDRRQGGTGWACGA